MRYYYEVLNVEGSEWPKSFDSDSDSNAIQKGHELAYPYTLMVLYKENGAGGIEVVYEKWNAQIGLGRDYLSGDRN